MVSFPTAPSNQKYRQRWQRCSSRPALLGGRRIFYFQNNERQVDLHSLLLLERGDHPLTHIAVNVLCCLTGLGQTIHPASFHRRRVRLYQKFDRSGLAG